MTETEVLIARIRAVLRLISPDDITPMGVRMIEKVLDDAENPAKATLYGDLVKKFNDRTTND